MENIVESFYWGMGYIMQILLVITEAYLVTCSLLSDNKIIIYFDRFWKNKKTTLTQLPSVFVQLATNVTIKLRNKNEA